MADEREGTGNVLLVNFKNYEESTRQNALPLARLAEAVAKEEGRRVVIVVNSVELALIAREVKIPVFAQHSDPEAFGRGTGKVLPEVIRYHGAAGTVLNHAEFKLTDEVLEKCIGRAKQAGLEVLVCAENAERAARIASMAVKPDMIAIEPPELIGGEISVSTANPGIVTESVRRIKEVAPDIRVICGAGVKTKDDVKAAIELGADGVFVSSGVIKAKDRKGAMAELARGL
jgi:triosephosphate isomerase